MEYSTTLLPQLLKASEEAINANAESVTLLDLAIGDGDHVANLQRGLAALIGHGDELSRLDWVGAWQKIGMLLMTTVGGASGSLLGTLFMAMARAAHDKPADRAGFAEVFAKGVDSVKQRGKADVGEKTMLDVLVPVSEYLLSEAAQRISTRTLLKEIQAVAIVGAEATKDMMATKGRAAYLGPRSIGHMDAGAKTSQLVICALCTVLLTTPT